MSASLSRGPFARICGAQAMRDRLHRATIGIFSNRLTVSLINNALTVVAILDLRAQARQNGPTHPQKSTWHRPPKRVRGGRNCRDGSRAGRPRWNWANRACGETIKAIGDVQNHLGPPAFPPQLTIALASSPIAPSSNSLPRFSAHPIRRSGLRP